MTDRYADRAAQILLIACTPNLPASEQVRQIAKLLELTRSEGELAGVNIGVKHYDKTLRQIDQIMTKPPLAVVR